MVTILKITLALWITGFLTFGSGKFFYDVYDEWVTVKTLGAARSVTEGEVYEKQLSQYSFEIEGDVSGSVILCANAYYLIVPKYIRDMIEDKGWSIILTDKDIQEFYYDGEVEGRLSGVTNYLERKIYIHGSIYDVCNAFLHEIGHFVDYAFGGPSLSSEFIELYKEEKELLKNAWEIDSHDTSNEQEYFAESFALYIKDKEIKYKIPKTYNYMKLQFQK